MVSQVKRVGGQVGGKCSAVTPTLGAGGGVSETAPKVRRVAIPGEYVEDLFFLSGNVAVLLKQPIEITIRCAWKLRSYAAHTWRSPFVVRGGVRLIPLPEPQVVEVDGKAYRVLAYRDLRHARILYVDNVAVVVTRDDGKFYSWRPFNEPRIVVLGWLTFEFISDKEVKLVTDSEPTHILFIIKEEHPVEIHGAEQHLIHDDTVHCSGNYQTLKVLLVPIGQKFTVCHRTRNKHVCHAVTATLPPKYEPIPETQIANST